MQDQTVSFGAETVAFAATGNTLTFTGVMEAVQVRDHRVRTPRWAAALIVVGVSMVLASGVGLVGLGMYGLMIH